MKVIILIKCFKVLIKLNKDYLYNTEGISTKKSRISTKI